jgi:hypothetical protein
MSAQGDALSVEPGKALVNATVSGRGADEMTAAMKTSDEPRLRHVQCLDARGLHRMAYWQWGDPANGRVLVCVHGLSRQGRDFDNLARAMQGEFRVVCPDVVGRGESDRLADPAGYLLPTYGADMVTLLARLDAGQRRLGGNVDGWPDRHGAGVAARIASRPARVERHRPELRRSRHRPDRRLPRRADRLGQ